jgi:hypothetical protein
MLMAAEHGLETLSALIGFPLDISSQGKTDGGLQFSYVLYQKAVD